MRTTINVSPETMNLLQQYVEYFQKRFGSRVSMSSAIEEGLGIALPLMYERIPQKGETPREFLLRRASDLERCILNNELTETEVLTLMREANNYQDDCRQLLLSNSKGNSMDQIEIYQDCLKAFLATYNAGAGRLNKGQVVKTITKKC